LVSCNFLARMDAVTHHRVVLYNIVEETFTKLAVNDTEALAHGILVAIRVKSLFAILQVNLCFINQYFFEHSHVLEVLIYFMLLASHSCFV
jgi:hypothetical protein